MQSRIFSWLCFFFLLHLANPILTEDVVQSVDRKEQSCSCQGLRCANLYVFSRTWQTVRAVYVQMNPIKCLHLHSQMHMPAVLAQHLRAVCTGNLRGSKNSINLSLFMQQLLKIEVQCQSWSKKMHSNAHVSPSKQLARSQTEALRSLLERGAPMGCFGTCTKTIPYNVQLKIRDVSN